MGEKKERGLDLERFRDLGPIDLFRVKGVYRALSLLGLEDSEIIELANIGGLSDSVNRLRGENEKLKQKVDELSSLIAELSAKLAALEAQGRSYAPNGFEAQVLRMDRGRS